MITNEGRGAGSGGSPSGSGCGADRNLSREGDPGSARLGNEEIARKLEEAAALLELQGAEPYRAQAYRRAARTARTCGEDLRRLFEEGGPAALERLPGIGRGIAAAIAELLIRGRWARLDRLRGELDPVQLFQSVPGVGPELARRIHEHLQVDSLEALEQAAWSGALEEVPGIGPRRAAAIRAALDAMLRRVRPARRRREGPEPDVGLLLDVDREYREKAAAGRLPRIAPRRFNPEGRAWLPVLHASRSGWHFTAMYSNTARAHELGRTGDWVVVYAYDEHPDELQYTVVTETRGPLAGRRVVRGREGECLRWYAEREAAPA